MTIIESGLTVGDARYSLLRKLWLTIKSRNPGPTEQLPLKNFPPDFGNTCLGLQEARPWPW